MEWLLILLTSLPMIREDIGDLRFPTKVECLMAGEDILAGRTLPDRPQTDAAEEEDTEKGLFLEPIYTVSRNEIRCVEVPKK